jgi:dTDP-4-amino-4,6-dideoxy-D-galactose acyltransferase
MSSSETSLVQILLWDSAFFGFPVASVGQRTLTFDDQRRIDEFAARENVVLVQFLCDSSDRGSVLCSEGSGYTFVDIRHTLKRGLAGEQPEPELGGLRFGRGAAADVPALREIARDAYRESRFYFDERFDRQKVIALYQIWVEKGTNGTLDDRVYVLYEGTRPVAFCTIKEVGPQQARIGLFGVDGARRDRGLGTLLLRCVLSQVQQDAYTSMIVVTQGRNYGAQQLYEKCGFVTDKMELWYHKWYR